MSRLGFLIQILFAFALFAGFSQVAAIQCHDAASEFDCARHSECQLCSVDGQVQCVAATAKVSQGVCANLSHKEKLAVVLTSKAPVSGHDAHRFRVTKKKGIASCFNNLKTIVTSLRRDSSKDALVEMGKGVLIGAIIELAKSISDQLGQILDSLFGCPMAMIELGKLLVNVAKEFEVGKPGKIVAAFQSMFLDFGKALYGLCTACRLPTRLYAWAKSNGYTMVAKIARKFVTKAVPFLDAVSNIIDLVSNAGDFVDAVSGTLNSCDKRNWRQFGRGIAEVAGFFF